MKIHEKRRPAAILRGLFLLTHPMPVSLHIVGVALFALLAAWPTIAWRTLALVVLAHAFMQLAIAILNDYSDRRQDALSKKTKPIPLGLVRPREALLLGLLCIVLMLLLLLYLPPLALLISLLYLACGLAYNFGLKGTPFSGVVFALAIPLIPLYAFVGMGHIIPLVFWLVPVAALLGIALNLADSLPDIEDDAAQGVRTLAVVLGLRKSILACPSLIFLALITILVLALTHAVSVQPLLFWLVALLTLVLIVIQFSVGTDGARPLVGTDSVGWIGIRGRAPSVPTSATKIRRKNVDPDIQRRKTYFYLVVLTCLFLVIGWIIGALL